MAVTFKKGRDPVSRPYMGTPTDSLPQIPAENWVVPEWAPFQSQRGVMKVPRPVQPKAPKFLTEDAFIEKDRQKEALRALRRDFDADPEERRFREQRQGLGPLNLGRGEWQLNNPGEVIPKTKIPLPLAKLLSDARIARQSREFTKGVADTNTMKFQWNEGPLANWDRIRDAEKQLFYSKEFLAPTLHANLGAREGMKKFLQEERDLYAQRNPWGGTEESSFHGRKPTNFLPIEGSPFPETAADIAARPHPSALGGTGLFEGRADWHDYSRAFANAGNPDRDLPGQPNQDILRGWKPSYPEHSWKAGPSKDPYTRQLRLRTLENLKARSWEPLTEQQLDVGEFSSEVSGIEQSERWGTKERAFQQYEKTRPRTPWGSPTRSPAQPIPRNRPWLNLP